MLYLLEIMKEILEAGSPVVYLKRRCVILADGILDGELAQLARAPALHAGGHRFDSGILHQVR